MKLNGIFGTGSGKTGNAVFATSAGKQIVRTYQPKVTNPNTDAQIAQRAKFKLLSQLAAAMAPVIAIPKDGLTSSRNMFVKINTPLASYANGSASIALASIKLTNSVRSLPEIGTEAGTQMGTLNVYLLANVDNVYSNVMWAIFDKTEDKKLQLVSTSLVSTGATGSPNAAHTFENLPSGEYVVYAYGMIPKNVSSSVSFENYEAEEGETNAILLSSLSITAKNYNLSDTKGVEVEVSE